MLGKWRLSHSSVKKNANAMSPGTVDLVESCAQHGNATVERRRLTKGFYFCLVQSLPTPSCFVFAETGDYIVGCNCTIHTSDTLVSLPLGTSPQCRGACGHLRVKVRERSISVRQSPQVAAPSSREKLKQSDACHFVKESAGKGLEVFAQVDSAENCTFRMLPVYGVNWKTPCSDESNVCSFSIRRVLLGTDRPFRRCMPKAAVEMDPSSSTDEVSSFTEYELPVSRRFEVFRDIRLGKGGNGEVFLGIDRSQGEAVAIKREPKEMLRHEFSLINDIRLDGPLLIYKAQDPHPSKFLGLLTHSVAVEVGNSAVAAATAHHSAVDDEHDHLVLELVTGGELRKLIKTKYASGMPVRILKIS